VAARQGRAHRAALWVLLVTACLCLGLGIAYTLTHM
jgi:hypothetical protein